MLLDKRPSSIAGAQKSAEKQNSKKYTVTGKTEKKKRKTRKRAGLMTNVKGKGGGWASSSGKTGTLKARRRVEKRKTGRKGKNNLS